MSEALLGSGSQERKKLRTQRRLAAEKEKQDQIRCGLMAPPPPKIKISNLMQAMKNEAVADPSALEAKVRAERAAAVKDSGVRLRLIARVHNSSQVRAEIAQRVKNHEERSVDASRRPVDDASSQLAV